MRIDVWSDIACPWCWLGRRHLDEALRLEGASDVEVHVRSFELRPERHASEPALPHLARKLGGAERVRAIHARLVDMGRAVGIEYDFERALFAHTFDAHRVHHHASSIGKGAEVMERFIRGYHGEGEDLADHETIARLAVDAGLDASSVRHVLASDAFADAVRADEAEAHSYGIHGVPFFLFDGRLGVSGAQPVSVFVDAIRQARGSAPPE